MVRTATSQRKQLADSAIKNEFAEVFRQLTTSIKLPVLLRVYENTDMRH